MPAQPPQGPQLPLPMDPPLPADPPMDPPMPDAPPPAATGPDGVPSTPIPPMPEDAQGRTDASQQGVQPVGYSIPTAGRAAPILPGPSRRR